MEVTDVQYKESETGVIPVDWEVYELSELVDFLDGKRRPIKDSDRAKMQGQYPYFGASGIIDYVNDYLFNDELILLGEDGENILSRNVRLAFKVSGKIWVNNHAHVLKPKEHIDIGFLTEKLESINYEKYNSGTAQPKLNQKTCSKIPVSLPPTKSEQTAIATALSDTDALIENLEKLIAKKRNIKQGVMQELFSPKKDWKLTSLGELIDVLTDYTANGSFESLKNNVQYYETKNYAVLVRTTDLDKAYFEPQRFTDKKGYDFLSKTALFGGEIIIANVGSIGKVFRVPFFDMPMTLAPNTYLIRFKKEIDENYIYQWMLTDEFYVKLMSKIGSSTLQAINKDNLRDIELRIPNNIKNQEDTASILSDMDKDIKESTQKLNKYRMLKHGMMQTLLTGKIRLI